MKISLQQNVRLQARLLRWTLVAVLTSCLPAFAALGGTTDSVRADQAQMKASLTIERNNAYTLHEMKTPGGTLVREYVSPSGVVFGLSWQGPFVPDMHQLLGEYFERYSESAKRQRESHVGRRPLNLQEPGLIVQTAGHMRAYSGRAFDPDLLPAGVVSDDIR